ncbi:MAG: FtsX-like permease family protein [Cellulosilyticaceae bacterium]
MLKVNNKKTINNLVKSSLKTYKMRSVFTLITIVLSVSLIAGLTFMSSAIQQSKLKELAIRQHVIYHEVNQEQMMNLEHEPQIAYSKVIKKGQSFEKDDYILIPSYIEQNNAPMIALDILEGYYPQQANEVLVYDQMLIKMGLEPRAGESLSITYLDGTVEEYVVSGLLEAEATNVFSLYFSKEYAMNGSQLKHIPFDLTAQIVDAQNMEKEAFLSVIRNIGAEYGIERKNINENDAFVRMLAYSFTEGASIVLATVVILMVSVLVIYSIFYISISERTRQIGQLRTIGMTKKQIKKMVRKEGSILSLIGSTIGIAIGALFAFSIKPEGFAWSNFISYTLFILIANYITVQFSIAKSAMLASSISPIEATRISGYEVQVEAKKTKCIQRKLSPLSLSMIAARGNRKKSMMTMISLGLAGIVFMCAGSFISAIDEEKFSRQGWFGLGEYIIQIASNAAKVNTHGEMGVKVNNPLNNSLVSTIQAIEGVEEVIEMQTLSVSYSYGEYMEKDVVAPFSESDVPLLSAYLQTGSVDYERMVQNKELIIVHNEMVKEIFGWEFKLGDTVTLQWFDGEKERADTFTIGAILEPTNKLYHNPEMFKLAYNAGWFMIPQDLLQQMMMPEFNLNTRMIISCEDGWDVEDSIELKIVELTKDNPLLTLSRLKNTMEHHKQQFNMTYTTFMGAALFVIAFSIINLLNTLISNTMARKREFACIGALGATNKQIKTMIWGEALYFALINIGVTLTLGTMSGYGVVKFANWNGITYLDYQFPWHYLIGYSLFVLVVTIVLSSSIAKIMGKKSLVERLREAD